MPEYDPFTDTEKKILAVLSTDLDVALTFVHIAAHARSNAEKRGRNIQNATQAYESSVAWLAKLNTTPEENPDIERKLSTLRHKLKSLGVTILD